ncbi:MAG: hypothetical protein WBD05_05530 [Phycisphaerae bacterium]
MMKTYSVPLALSCPFLVLFVAAVFPGNAGGGADQKPTSPARTESAVWSDILHRGLMLYYEGRHKETFELVERELHTLEPGPEAHRCIRLARKAFIAMHGLEEPVREWNEPARKHINAFLEKKEASGADAVLAAALLDTEQKDPDATIAAGDILRRLMQPERKSPWADWAFWERARILASKAWVPTRDLGVVEYADDGRKKLGCLAKFPARLIQARAAKDLLRRHPESYMGEQMRCELAFYRAEALQIALEELRANEWYVPRPEPEHQWVLHFSEEQLAHLEKMRDAIRKVDALFPKDAALSVRARKSLDRFLWEGGGRALVLEYFSKMLEMKHPSLPNEVAKWAARLPKPKRLGDIGEVRMP